MQTSKIQLKLSAFLGIPIDKYDKNFTFIVNGEEFKTSRIVSDLLSPKIAKNHSTDPTFETFTIETTNQGNFSHILNLVNFIPNNLPESQLPFISEVIELLGNESIELLCPNNSIEITEENVFENISNHERYSKFYSKQLSKEIDFIASNFFNLCEKHEDELMALKIETIHKIVNNSKLKLKDEDQLLNFVNHMYVKDTKYSVLYEFVYFTNASAEAVSDFIDVFDFNDFTQNAWNRVSIRLKQKVSNEDCNESRYQCVKRGIEFPFQSGKEFSGIINYLSTKSNGNIENVINFTCSSNDWIISESYKPRFVALFNESDKFFVSGNHGKDEWICLDFKEHRIVPTHYTVRSSNYEVGNWHPKSWVIEASNDNKTWTTIDQQQNCSYLNGPRYVHTFSINQKQKSEFQYIRMHNTDKDWSNYYYLAIETFEIYGSLI